MSLYVKTIKVKTPVATGDQTVTCLGFKPKVVIAHGSMTPAATPNTLVDEFFFHFGAYAQDGTQMAMGDWAGDNGHGKIKSSSSNVKLVYLYDADGLAWEAAVTSVSDTEVVINWTNLPSGATERDMFLTCWGGGDIQDSMVKAFVSQAGGLFASQPTTGVGFQPTGILFFSQGEGSDADAVLNDTVIHSSIGFAASATQQASMGWAAGSVTSQELSNSVLRTDRCISRPHGDSILSSHALDATFSLSSFDSDGFTGVWADNDNGGANTGPFVAYALCIKGPQFQAVNDTQPAAAGTSSTTTTFPPGSGLFMSIGKAAASAIQGHTRISLGSGNDSGSSGSHFGSITHQSTFGSSVSSDNSDVKSITAVNRVIQNKTETGLIQGDARLVKMNPDKKIDFAWPNADSTARQWAAFVIGGSATKIPLQWTSNSHIDRKFHLTGTVAGNNTVWTLPITDETIDTVVLGPDFGDLEGTVVSVTTDGATVTATGSDLSPVDYSGGVVVVGRSYIAEIELTRPFLTDDQKNQVTNAGVLIHKMAVSHSHTGEYLIRIEQPNRTAREQTFTPLDGSQIEAVGTRQYIISGNAKDTVIKIRNTTPKPSTIVGVEYIVTAIPRSFI